MKKVQIFIDSSSEPFVVNMDDVEIYKLSRVVKDNTESGYLIENDGNNLLLAREHISAVFIEKGGADE